MIASQTWWHLARTAGLVAWALICASVIWGLLLSTRVLGRRPTRPWLLAMHRYLSALAIGATAVHVVALLADSYIQFRIVDVLVPMASPWRPGAVAWGIVALYLLLIVEMTSLVAERLPRGVWWTIHLSSFALFTFGTIHGLQTGTDAGNALVRIAMIVGIAEVAFVLSVRIVYRRRDWR
ncbi:MAG TPA: ferric reductase-like transmembrane domain-containing protein [Acidimicrobiales bacterium]|nr:ferric reductase-like transmembrane domain-containing protein [Acidimicrobiales bacterium]